MNEYIYAVKAKISPDEWGEEEFYLTKEERDIAERFYLTVANVETKTRDIKISRWEPNKVAKNGN